MSWICIIFSPQNFDHHTNTHAYAMKSSGVYISFFSFACAVLSLLCTPLSLKIAKERHRFPTPSSKTTLFIVSLAPWILCFNTCCSVQPANTAEGCLNPKNKLFSLQCAKQHSTKTFQLILAE